MKGFAAAFCSLFILGCSTQNVAPLTKDLTLHKGTIVASAAFPLRAEADLAVLTGFQPSALDEVTPESLMRSGVVVKTGAFDKVAQSFAALSSFAPEVLVQRRGTLTMSGSFAKLRRSPAADELAPLNGFVPSALGAL